MSEPRAFTREELEIAAREPDYGIGSVLDGVEPTAAQELAQFALMLLDEVESVGGGQPSALRQAWVRYRGACQRLAEGALLPEYGSAEDVMLRSAQHWPEHMRPIAELRQAASRARVEYRKALEEADDE